MEIIIRPVREADAASIVEVLNPIIESGTYSIMDRPGIGRRLCQATFQRARALGFRKLIAVIRADNPLALAFYKGQGFRVIGTAQGHASVRGRLIDQVLAARRLD